MDFERKDYETISNPTLLFKIGDHDPNDPVGGSDSGGSDQGHAPVVEDQPDAGTQQGAQATTKASTASKTSATTKATDKSGEGETGKTSSRP